MSIQTEIRKSFTTVPRKDRPGPDSDRGTGWWNAALILILVLEFVVLFLRARSKLFWYDELVTVHISGLQPFSRLWDALNNGADSMSIGYELIVRLAQMLPVDPLIAVRVPSMLGYLASLLGVYWFVTRKLPQIAGIAAILLMSLSSYRWYATEARGYALTVGFLAISVALWQRIGEKRFFTALFGLTLFLAVASHSLALVTIGCFALAELACSNREQRIRWGVWVSFAIAAIPFLVALNQLAHLRSLFAAHFWARTPWSGVITAPGDYFDLGPRMLPALVVFSVAGFAWLLRSAYRDRGKSDEEFSLPDVVLMGAFLLYPAVLVVLMKLHGPGYTSRYGLPGILGLIPALIYMCRTQCTENVFRWITVALLVTCGLQMAHDFEARAGSATRAAEERWATLARVARERPDLPIVIASSHDFFEESEYGPEDLKARTFNLADKDASYRLIGSDSSDVEDLLLAQLVPVRFEAAAPFLEKQSEFVLQSGEPEDWLTPYLLEKRYKLSLVANDAAGSVYIVER